MFHKSRDGSVIFMVLLWMGRNWRCFLSTTSHAGDVKAYYRIRCRQTEEVSKRVKLTVPQPNVCELYYFACAQVYRHNRCRQDDLNLENKVLPKDWSFRVNFSL